MDQWTNKVAVVTAANSRIGAEICRQLCAHAVTVIGLTIHIDQLDDLGEEIHANNDGESQFHAVQCDLANEDEIQRAVEFVCSDFGGVDLLVNCNGNAGAYGQLFLEDDTEENAIRTSVLGLVSLAKKAYRSMVERDSSGYILNISPTMAGFGSNPISAAVDAFTAELGLEICALNKPKIRVTNLKCSHVSVGGECDNGRFVGPKDIAATVIYCLSTPAHVQVHDISMGSTVGGHF